MMLGFNPYTILGAVGAVLAAFAFGLWKGYSYEHEKFLTFKAQVVAETKIQEAKVESITKQQDIVTKGITNEYEAKLAAIRNYYSSFGLRNPSTSGKQVPRLPSAPEGIDAATAYTVLAGQCTETTLMLTSLQDWVNAQVGIK
jgi:hypothetical protein